jgi:hypothetical protein
MKKNGILLAGVLTLIFCSIAYGMVEWKILSSEKFIGGKGKPVSETFTFSALGGQAILKLTNKRVSSASVHLNGQAVFGSSDFNQNVNYLESDIALLEGQNTLEVLLKGKPGGEVTIHIIQEVQEITPKMVLFGTANFLRAGDIEGALEGFVPDEKRERLIRALDSAHRDQLAYELESAALVKETPDMRFYRYTWTDASGENFVEYIMARDEEANWIITSW